MSSGIRMHKMMATLFPISRSVVGPGYDKSLEFLTRGIVSGTKTFEFASGTRVGSWTVPQSWELLGAKLSALDGSVIVSTEDSNLQVWSHSRPFSGVISRKDLDEHLVVGSNDLDSVPYATTYYRDNWGFCLSKEQYSKLQDINYRVEVNTIMKPGSLKVWECYVPGKVKYEIFFTTYLCHPSMANNELSGPVLMRELIRRVENRDNYFSYRFVIAPETIGPICYINSPYFPEKENILAGFNLTCVGDDRNWSLLPSRTGNTPTDLLARHLLKWEVPSYQEYPFLERGSDERQYNSPVVDLPMVSIMRSKYHEYPEYHTSKDDLDFVTANSLQETADFYEKLLSVLEYDGIYLSNSIGEPFLTEILHYPSVGAAAPGKDKRPEYRLLLDFLAYADGRRLVEIAESMEISACQLIPIIDIGLAHNLIRRGL